MVESLTQLYGRVYNTITFTDVDKANAFMEKNSDYGLLKDDGNEFHLAKMDDEGMEIV